MLMISERLYLFSLARRRRKTLWLIFLLKIKFYTVVKLEGSIRKALNEQRAV